MRTKQPFNKLLGITAGSLLALASAPQALALTASGTNISNSASVDYEVGGINQTDITSNTVTIMVDAKVDLTVAGTGGNLNVTPNTSAKVLRFTVQNTGNETFDYSLAYVASATDNFDATAIAIYVDANANNSYDSGTDTATTINDLAAGSTISVFVVGNIPASPTNGQTASYKLVATTLLSNGGAVPAETTDTATTKQYVYADGDGDAAGTDDASRDKIHSASLSYVVVTSALTVSKSSSVIWDPVNLSTNPLHIPGAIVEYTITISNAAGGAQADAVILTDTLDGNLQIPTDDARNYAAGKSIQLTTPNLYSGAATALTNAGSDDEGTVSGQTVTVNGIVLTASQSATIKIRAEIK